MMRHMLRAGLFLALAVGLAGCAGGIRADVTQFHQLRASLVGKTFFVQGDITQPASQEFQHDAALVSRQLEAKGLVPATAATVKSADLVVLIHLRLAGSRLEFFGYPGPYRHAFPPPGPMDTRVVSGVELDVNLMDGPSWRAAQPVMIFEGRAFAETLSPDINALVVPLAQALFSEFPAPSGETRQVWVEPEEPRVQ